MKKIIFGIFVAVFIIGICLGLKQNNTYQNTPIKVGSRTFIAEVADTEAKRTLGLSGRKSLPTNQGMLFVFDEPSQPGFWMKDMNFPIDIIWFDKNRKIVGIEKNLQPNSYPQVFYPPQEVSSALEINAGILSPSTP